MESKLVDLCEKDIFFVFLFDILPCLNFHRFYFLHFSLNISLLANDTQVNRTLSGAQIKLNHKTRSEELSWISKCTILDSTGDTLIEKAINFLSCSCFFNMVCMGAVIICQFWLSTQKLAMIENVIISCKMQFSNFLIRKWV